MKKLNKNLIIYGGVSLALILTIVFLSQAQIHLLFEAIAIPFGIFFIWYGQTKARGFYKYLFTIFGIGTLIIDGWLLLVNGGVI